MTIPFVSGGLSHLSMKESFVENKGHFWRKKQKCVHLYKYLFAPNRLKACVCSI